MQLADLVAGVGEVNLGLHISGIGGGVFGTAGGYSSQRIARWGCESAVPDCPADVDVDGTVSGLDLAIILGAWTGAAPYTPCPPSASVDLNGDCRVDGYDLALVFADWGACE